MPAYPRNLVHPDAPSWQDVVTQTERALACGALRSFDTTQSVIDDGGVRFLIRQAANLRRKEEAATLAARSASAWRDPFSPCEAALRVGDIGARHFLLLNKFNVLAHHLLIVTNDFETQESLIDESDFAALFACLARVEALGFYNGGTIAGSSQPHKHLQLVPLPLDGHVLPIEPCIEAARTDALFQAPQLAFRHAAAWLADDDPVRAHTVYLQLLKAIGVERVEIAGVARQSAPYNLLVTRRWMLAVPRSVPDVQGVAVNALGFAGSLFVRDDAQRRIVETLGPMQLLANATIS
ncbi:MULTISPECIES: phosphorylase [unclassified Caballeronia]|uniref:ATP adenylyltransferase family protein n=1 Tax=unclassified Caballeronia TaxID=2646786 RepID=UPI0028605B8F|nr:MULTISPECIES: phosphorylase [unclassified Caballeronia]MDR5818156.1 phosphorylase [Caballeronia sp. LZ033]MDR5882995.1 phosphorylase [Caballeronia sp. LZ032]